MSMEGDRAEVARVMVGHANTMQIHTNNVINWNLLKKHKFHPAMTSADELMDALQSTMETWIGNISLDPLNIPDSQSLVEISNSETEAPIDVERREKLKLSVKLFLCDWRPELIRPAVDKVLRDLGVQKLDTLMISFPVTPPASIETNKNLTTAAVMDMEKVKPIWQEVQSTVDSGHVVSAGVCDFDRSGLDQLHEWARIKPKINQINLTNCCAVPSDLIQYSREKEIQLLTHSDPPEIISARSLQTLVSETVDDIDHVTWAPAFIARYSVLVRYRGIVHSKGYFVAAERRSSTGNATENYRFF